MALNLPQVPFKLTAEDMGSFDLGTALRSGFDTFNKFQEARYKPKSLAEGLLAAQLQNKINASKAKYADQLAEAGLAHTQAGTGLLGEQARGLRLSNENLPEKLRLQLQQERLKANHPELFAKGVVGDLARLQYFSKQNAGLLGDQTQQLQQPQQLQQLQQTQQPQQPDLLNQQNTTTNQGEEQKPSQQSQQSYVDRLREALIAKASGRPAQSLTNFDKAQMSYENAIREHGVGSEEARIKKEYLDKISGSTKVLTPTLKVLHQKIVLGVPKVIKQIDDLIALPSPINVKGLSMRPNAFAAHDAKVAEAEDNLVAAKGWKGTVEDFQKAERILSRHNAEDDKAYRNRLTNLKKDLGDDYKISSKALGLDESNNLSDPLGLR